MNRETAEKLRDLLRPELDIPDGCFDALAPNPFESREEWGVGILLRYGIEEGGNAESGPQIYTVPESWVELDFEPDEAGHLGKWVLRLFSFANDETCACEGNGCQDCHPGFEPTPHIARIEVTQRDPDCTLEQTALDVAHVLKAFVPGVVDTRPELQDSCPCGGGCCDCH